MLWAIVPAAGRGSRLPGELPKQYRRLAGRSVLDHCLARLLSEPRISGVMLALAADDAHWAHSEFARDPRVLRCQGGAERADSVLAALLALRVQRPDLPDDCAVLVHDAARALLPAAALARLVDEPPGADGALLAVPAQDTLKWTEDGERSARTLERRQIWQAQTPQYFEYARLRDALSNALAKGTEITDEASCMEKQGFHPRLIAGDALNFKITTPADLAMAAALLEQT